jgi:AcrR family transcriptional regulator
VSTSAGKADSADEPRRRNARGSGDRLRREIVDAAIRLLERLGPDEPFSLRAVAKEARISAPSVYLQFADRNLLLVAVLEQLFQDLAALRSVAEEKVTQAGGGAWDRLMATILASVEFGLQRPGHFKVLYEGRVVPRLDDPKAAAFGRPLQTRTVELVRAIVSESSGRGQDDPERLSLLLWAGIHGLISLRINKPTLDWPEMTELVEQMARAVIRPGGAPTSTRAPRKHR